MEKRRSAAGLALAGLAVAALAGCRSAPPSIGPDEWKGLPVGYFAALDTPIAIRARREILREPGATDEDEATMAALAILCRQQRDGSWGHDVHATGKNLWNLADLAVPAAHPAIARATEWIMNLGRNPLALEVRNEAWGDRWIALRALLRLGQEEHPAVRRTIDNFFKTADEWFGAGIPGQTEGILLALSVDPKLAGDDRVDEILARLEAAQKSDGTWDGISFFDTIEALAGFAAHPRAKAVFEKACPRILATQELDGTWFGGTRDRAEDTFAAMWALQAFGKAAELEGGAAAAPGSALAIEIRLVASADETDAAAFEGPDGHAVRTGAAALLSRDRIVGASCVRSAEDADKGDLVLEFDADGRGVLKSLGETSAGRLLALIVDGRAAAVFPMPGDASRGLHIFGIPIETAQAIAESFAGAPVAP
ncbi:MAG: hypothetical protein JXP34_22450 [Planctomycetes bacterium]|nr:hypothetical protein [Planctomycetota bacterium]